MPKAHPGAICSDELAKPIGSYVHESAYYAYKPGLGQGGTIAMTNLFCHESFAIGYSGCHNNVPIAAVF
jgi:hypothetical protein